MNDKPKELKEYSAQIFELGCMERPVYLKEDVDAVIAGLKQKLQDQCISCHVKMQEDDVIADLEERHKKEVEQLLMKIAGLEKLVETADKFVKQKARYDLLQEHSGFSWRREIDFYFRWYQRWLELAEKFKDKEAK